MFELFPFNQPEKTRDCGYRCLYYSLIVFGENIGKYEQWLQNFRFFAPVLNGIGFKDIHIILDHYGLDYRFTVPTEKGLYIIYSGCWLKHGHYFVYHNGEVLRSTKSEPEEIPACDVIARLSQARSIDQAWRCLKVLGKKQA